MRKFVKSEAEDQFDVDEELVNEVADAGEFKGVEITAEDILDAVRVIDDIADAVIDKANVEEKKLDADELLDEVRDIIDENHEDKDELDEEEELPEQLNNTYVRVMVSRFGEITAEQTPDEIYPSDMDGVECTVYDTCALPPVEVEDSGNTNDNTDNELLVIGNSKAKSFDKGFVKLKVNSSKKAWSSAYKKVRKLIGNSKMSPAHWAIVSAISKAEDEKDKLRKKVECALLKKIRSDKLLMSRLIKSLNEFDVAGVPKDEVIPDETFGTENGYMEGGSPTDAVSPEILDSESGNPVTKPDMMVNHEDDVTLPEDSIVVITVPIANSKKRIAMKKVCSRALRGFSAYRVLSSSRDVTDSLDGKVVKSGKFAYVFKDTANGLLACAAKFVDCGKGKYVTVMKNNKVCISKGKDCKIFNNVEKYINIKRMVSSARHSSVSSRGLRSLRSSSAISGRPSISEIRSNVEARIARRNEIKASIRARLGERKSVNNNAKKIASVRREAVLAKIEAKREIRKAQMLASRNEARLMEMHDAEERQRLFQSSQATMNEEKIVTKQESNRNSRALDTMYDSLF